MIHESVQEIRLDCQSAVGIDDQGRVELLDEQKVRGSLIDTLARNVAFGREPVQAFSRWLIWEIGQALGAQPASIHDLYMARARGEWHSRTVPAMNMRATNYDSTRAALRAAKRTRSAAIIFEIARAEMSYTYQEPPEFAAMIIAAAIKEGYTSPLFIQGDHFQVKAERFWQDPEGAIQEVKDLARTAIRAGFYNIDIDTSTLVTLEPESLDEQQRHNYLRSAELTQFIRGLEPEGITISLGGEIGEVGEKNSTVEELDAYMLGYERTLADLGEMAGLSKVSVQTGTHHGGILLPDGSQADVNVDFDLILSLGDRAREHGAGGAVQHGASTLPDELFSRFPAAQTLEIHLATGFTNTFLDHPHFPDEIRQQMYAHLDRYHADERKPNATDIMFHKAIRKKAFGPFKPELWTLSPERQEAIYAALEEYFAFFYRELNVVESKELVEGIVSPVAVHRPMPGIDRGMGDDQGLAD